MSKFTKLTFVAIFALLIVGSLFAVEARDLNRRQESGPSDAGKSGLPSATTPPDATGTGTDVPDTPPTGVPTAPTDAAPPADSGLPGTGKASDIASLLNSAAQSGVPPSAAASPSPSSGSGSSGPATTPSSANKIENGIFGVAIAALVSLLL